MSSPGNSNKTKSGTVVNALLKSYLLPLMEANGWTVERKTRSGEGANPNHIDWYFFPPGVVRGRGNTLRKDFFDSTTQVLNYLKWDTGNNLSQFVHSFLERTQEVAKAEGKALAKLRAANYDRFLEVITSKVNIPLPTDINETEEFTNFWNRSHSRPSSESFENARSTPVSSHSSAAGKKRKSTSSETSKKEKKEMKKKKTSKIIDTQRPDTELRTFPSISTQENIRVSENMHQITDSGLSANSTPPGPTVTSYGSAERRLFERIRHSIEYDERQKEKERDESNENSFLDNDITTRGGSNEREAISSSVSVPTTHNLGTSRSLISSKSSSVAASRSVIEYSGMSKNHTTSSLNEKIPRKKKSKSSFQLEKSKENLQASYDNNTTDNHNSNASSRIVTESIVNLANATIPRKKKTALLSTSIPASTNSNNGNNGSIVSERCNNSKALNKSDATEIKADNKYYINFQQKLQPVRDIEFKGLHGQTVNKIMWKQHKLLFGKTCDDSCPCPSNLKEICKNVVTSARQSAIDKGDEAPQVVCVGFVTYFASRYYNALCIDFPQDCPAKILCKLLEMWKLHKKNKMYGETCGPLCGCDYAYFSNIILPSPSGNSLVQDKPLMPPPSPQAKRIEYSVTFDSSIPLGFYTTTRTRGLSSCCRIASVNPFRVDLDRRLLRGTAILATETGGVREELLSHLDLKSRYYKAQERGEKLTVWFLNQNTVAPSNYVQKKHWSRTGAWQGITDDGWAGGADLISKGHISEVSEKIPPAASDTASPEENNFLAWSVQTSSAKKPRPLMSALRSQVNKSDRKLSWSFPTTTKYKYFLKDEFEKQSSNRTAAGNFTDLTFAVRHGTVQDVLRVLTQNGADVEARDMNNKTAIQYASEQYSINEQSIQSAGEIELGLFGLKKKLLKFFLEANSIIYACEALYYWSYVDVSITGFRNVLQSDSTAAAEFFYVVKTADPNDRRSPNAPSSHSPTWHEDSLLKFSGEFHKHSYKESDFKVTLYAIEEKEQTKVGAWDEDINDYADRIKEGTTEYVSKLNCSSTIKEGEMVWRIERKQFSAKFAENARFTLASRLCTVISWLEKLMKDLAPHRIIIDANVAFPLHGKRTLLHAAVYLNDKTLVRKLLELGADPKFSGSLEASPLEIAAANNSYIPDSKRKETHTLLMSFLDRTTGV